MFDEMLWTLGKVLPLGGMGYLLIIYGYMLNFER